MDCSLKKSGPFFKLVVCFLEKSLKMIMVCTPIEKNTEFLPLGVPGTLRVRYSEVHVLSIINSQQCFDPKTILIAIKDRSISIGGMSRSN